MATSVIDTLNTVTPLEALWTLFMTQAEPVRKAFTQRILEMEQTKNNTEPARSLSAPMPCAFTDEEWEEELMASELEGDATKEEMKMFYEKWGIAI